MPDLPLEPPSWLKVGARVVVRSGASNSGRTYEATVLLIDWPWLVCLEERPGGIHPRNLSPLEADLR